MEEALRLQSQAKWAHILALPLLSKVTLGKSLLPPELQFPRGLKE